MLCAQTLTCKGCGGLFLLTEEKATMYNEKGYTNLPSRCNSCKKEKLNLIRRRRPNKNGRETEGEKREMIEVTCNCNGRESVVIKKPIKGAQFQIFRRAVMSAYGNEFDRHFKLFRNGVSLNAREFNSLNQGDEIDIILMDPEADDDN